MTLICPTGCLYDTSRNHSSPHYCVISLWYLLSLVVPFSFLVGLKVKKKLCSLWRLTEFHTEWRSLFWAILPRAFIRVCTGSRSYFMPRSSTPDRGMTLLFTRWERFTCGRHLIVLVFHCMRTEESCFCDLGAICYVYCKCELSFNISRLGRWLHLV